MLTDLNGDGDVVDESLLGRLAVLGQPGDANDITSLGLSISVHQVTLSLFSGRLLRLLAVIVLWLMVLF